MKLSFGKFKGQAIQTIPVDYLFWGAENLDNANLKQAFIAELQRRDKTEGWFQAEEHEQEEAWHIRLTEEILREQTVQEDEKFEKVPLEQAKRILWETLKSLGYSREDAAYLFRVLQGGERLQDLSKCDLRDRYDYNHTAWKTGNALYWNTYRAFETFLDTIL